MENIGEMTAQRDKAAESATSCGSIIARGDTGGIMNKNVNGNKRLVYTVAKEMLNNVCAEHGVGPCKLGCGPRSPSGGIAYFQNNSKYGPVIFMTARTIKVYTLLHEIAHYFVYVDRLVVDDAHGQEWFDVCDRLYRRYCLGHE